MTQPAPSPAASPTLVPIPNPAMCFVLVDLTTDATPAALRPGPALAEMAADALEQACGPYAAFWGLPPIAIRVASSPQDRGSNEYAAHFRDDIPEAPGALAFHQDLNGVPDIELGVSLFDSLWDDGESLLVGFTHELLELLLDPGANLWASLLDGSGKARAREASDVVQNTWYRSTRGHAVTNFVLPSFFIPGAPGPWDALGMMTSQNDDTHGYEIEGDDVANVGQVGGVHGLVRAVNVRGHLTARQLRRKSHPWSRARRRGAGATALAAVST